MGNSRSWIVVVSCGLVLCAAACGGDSSEPSGSENNPIAQAGAGGGGAGAAAAGAAAPALPAETAGKACAGDAECAPGTCATMVEGLDGQPTPAPGGYCMGDCTDDAQCGAGGVCVGAVFGQGRCYDGCMTDTDCRQGYLCGPLTSTCRPAPPTDQLADDTAGAPCTADADCGDGLCLTERANGEPYPGGYCSGACLEDAHCGAGGVCRRAGAGAGRCYETCASDADCARAGYRCRSLGGDAMGCLPAPDPLPDGTTGLACTSDADCGGAAGTCAAEMPARSGGTIAAPGGYCTLACEVDADCGAGGVCVFTRLGTRCFKTCTVETDCREGYVCGERGGGDMPSIVCTPREPDPDAGMGTGDPVDAGADAAASG